MNFNLNKSIALLERTPKVFKSLFYNLEFDWGTINEGEKTWSAYDIVGHLIHGEQTDWIPRSEIILGDGANKSFEPYDRFAQDKVEEKKTMNDLLEEFEELRLINIKKLKSWNLTEEDLKKEGIHPDFGSVSLKQLISTWTIHDATHLNQVSRVLVKHYADDVGPWKKYIGLLGE